MKKSTQKLLEWVSIKDAVPKQGEKALVYSKENAYRYAIGFYSETYRSFFVNQFADDGVTHWMPLPDAPKIEIVKNDRS